MMAYFSWSFMNGGYLLSNDGVLQFHQQDKHISCFQKVFTIMRDINSKNNHLITTGNYSLYKNLYQHDLSILRILGQLKLKLEHVGGDCDPL